MNRRDSIKALTVGLAAMVVSNKNAFAFAVTRKMTVYKDASCGCCKAWVEHVKKAGFDVTAIDVADVSVYKKKQGVPENLQSCHTAIVDGYTFEGHVPADLIEKFLQEKHTAARGLAVPGMPMGAPGMEMGAMKDKYDVVMFNKNGSRSVYAHR